MAVIVAYAFHTGYVDLYEMCFPFEPHPGVPPTPPLGDGKHAMLVYGVYSDRINPGVTVAAIRATVGPVWNIASTARPYINGQPVSEAAHVWARDRLEFIRRVS